MPLVSVKPALPEAQNSGPGVLTGPGFKCGCSGWHGGNGGIWLYSLLAEAYPGRSVLFWGRVVTFGNYTCSPNVRYKYLVLGVENLDN